MRFMLISITTVWVLKSLSVSGRIRHRKEALNRRREALSLATSMLSDDVAAEVITEEELSRERCEGP